MSARYNPESDADRAALGSALIDALSARRFIECDSAGERIFAFPVKDAPGVEVRVYTSCVGTRARAYAADAIRVALVYRAEDGSTRGLAKDARVFRTGEIPLLVARMVERAREVYAKAIRLPRCADCGAPTFESKRGNAVCARVCWTLPKPTPEIPANLDGWEHHAAKERAEERA